MEGPDDFLSRWSRRKRAARAGVPSGEEPAAQAPEPVPANASAEDPVPPAAPLPPVEELTPDSDFTPFMDRAVDPDLRSQALKKLFADPHFNVMDRLDTYIDDYSIPDPIPPEWLAQLTQMAGLGDVPGREKAEREAREAAERLAGAPEGSGDVHVDEGEEEGDEGPGDAPAALPDPQCGPRTDRGQSETLPGIAGCPTSSIPARKMGD